MIAIIHINISDFQVNNSVSGIYRISDIRIKQARNGNTYIKAVLFDATGCINIIYWEYDGAPINPASELVSVIGNVGTYMGSPQFTAESFQLLAAEDCQTIEMNGLVPSAPIDVDLYQLRLSNLVRSISEPSIYDVCVPSTSPLHSSSIMPSCMACSCIRWIRVSLRIPQLARAPA